MLEATNRAKTVKEMVERSRLTQVQFARASGISPQAINSFVRGRRRPNFDSLAKLLAFARIKNIDTRIWDLRPDLMKNYLTKGEEND